MTAILWIAIGLLFATLALAEMAWRRQGARLRDVEMQRDAALSALHATANSALRGCPVVRWSRPYPVPEGQPDHYDRVVIDGETHLFTSEQRREARRLANNLLPSGRGVVTQR